MLVPDELQWNQKMMNKRPAGQEAASDSTSVFVLIIPVD